MRRFRFRLAGVLRLRTQFEQQARRALAAAMADVASVEQRIAAAETGLRDCEAQARGAGAAARLAAALGASLRRHRLGLEREQRAAAARLDRARADWVERRSGQRALQRLRARRHAGWQAAVARQEQHEIEELARACARGALGRTEGGS